MQLDKIAIALRPRSGFEAVDLGFTLAMRWWRSVFLAWWLPVLPLAIALHLAFADYPIIAVLIVWWLKPLFDRCVLYSLSRRVFGEPTAAGQLLGAWRQILSPSLLRALTLGRLDPARSYNLPVTVLERQSGKSAKQRRKLLGQRFYGSASGLTLVCLNLEIIVQVGLFAMFSLFFAPGEDPLLDPSSSLPEFLQAEWWTLSDSLYYLLAIGLIEPLYVAAGFTLYLNRRVLLEGWDLELALKRLAQRLAPLAAALLITVVALIVPVESAQAHPFHECDRYLSAEADAEAEADYAKRRDAERQYPSDPLAKNPPRRRDFPEDAKGSGDSHTKLEVEHNAQNGQGQSDSEHAHENEVPDEDEDFNSEFIDLETEEVETKDKFLASRLRCQTLAKPPQQTLARQSITEILADPIFGRSYTVESWQLKEPAEDDDESSAPSPARFKGLGEFLASLSQVAAWVLLAGFLLILVRYIARNWEPTVKESAGAAPVELFGLAMNPDSLPDDIAAAAKRLIDEGQLREALALLYRGCLSRLVHGHGLRLNRGATEGDVLLRVGSKLDGAAKGFVQALINEWIELAYAEHAPQIEQLRRLCEQFDQHFPSRSDVGEAAIVAEPA